MKIFFTNKTRRISVLLLILLLYLNGPISADSFEKNTKIFGIPNIKNTQDLEQLLQSNSLHIQQQDKAQILDLKYDENSQAIYLDIQVKNFKKLISIEGIAKAISNNNQIIYIDGDSNEYNLIHASINKGWSGFVPFEGNYQLTSHLNLYLEDMSNNSIFAIKIPIANEFDALFNDIKNMDE